MRAAVYHQTARIRKGRWPTISEAIRLAPDVGLYYNDRGCIYKSLDNYAKAGEQFDEAIRIDPKLALAYANRGVNWHVEKKYDKAMADFDKALDIDPQAHARLQHAAATYGAKRGITPRHSRIGTNRFALPPMSRAAIATKPGCTPLACRSAIATVKWRWKMRRKLASCPSGRNGSYVAMLAAAYAELGKFDEAVEWQKKAIAMNKHPEKRDTIEQQKRLELYEAGMPFRDPEVSE